MLRNCHDGSITELSSGYLFLFQISHTVYLQTADGGQPGATICKLATENGASVIVLGSRGLGTIRRTLLGSVSDYVVHHSHIPTIVIPPPMS